MEISNFLRIRNADECVDCDSGEILSCPRTELRKT